MKNMKRLLAVAMTGVMAVSMLAGCGSSSEGEESDTIKIGSIHPLTGSYAYEAQSIINAQQLAVDEINAIFGFSILLKELAKNVLSEVIIAPYLIYSI